MTPGEQEPATDDGAGRGAGPEPGPDPDGGHDGDAVWRDWTREDLRRSALGGLAAYLATYGLLYLWFLSEGRIDGAVVDWRWVGRMLYHGQFVPLDVSPGGASAGGATAAKTGLKNLANVLPALLLSVAVAVGAGFLLARARDPAEPDRALEAGASLVVGYLPPAVLGVVVFAGTLPSGLHVRPDPLLAVLVTGLVFPAVVGAAGGLVYVAWRQRTADAPEGPIEDDAPDPETPGPRR